MINIALFTGAIFVCASIVGKGTLPDAQPSLHQTRLYGTPLQLWSTAEGY